MTNEQTNAFDHPYTSEEEQDIAEFLSRRIMDGAMELERVSLLLARYGLMDPEDFKAEMAERIALAVAS